MCPKTKNLKIAQVFLNFVYVPKFTTLKNNYFGKIGGCPTFRVSQNTQYIRYSIFFRMSECLGVLR